MILDKNDLDIFQIASRVLAEFSKEDYPTEENFEVCNWCETGRTIYQLELLEDN